MDREQKKAVVRDFVARCNRYADAQIERYRAQLTGATGPEALMMQDKIGHWTAYRTFNEYTLQELSTPMLDDWFD